MRRSLSLLIAVAIAASTASLAPAHARTIKAPLPVVTADASIEKIGNRDDRRWNKRRYSDRHWRDRRHSRRSYSQFYFPFPFFAPQRYSYAPRYRCHGRLVYYHGRYHCYAY
jgi:hypothetical protein